jgi:hypothetical protein
MNFVTDIVTAWRMPAGYVWSYQGVLLPLTWLLAAVKSCGGEYKSLGMTFNPNEGVAGLVEMAVYYAVPESAPFEKYLRDLQNVHRQNNVVREEIPGTEGEPVIVSKADSSAQA